MQKRGGSELAIFVFIAILGFGVLMLNAKGIDLTGAQSTRLRTVPRSGIQSCDNVNSMIMKLHLDFEKSLDAYLDIYKEIQLLIKIKLKILQITNTKLKTTVLTCRDWHTLVPGLSTYVPCNEIDTIEPEEDAERKEENITCSGDLDEKCKDVSPFKTCPGPVEGGDQSLGCKCEKFHVDKQPVCVPYDDKQLWIFQKNVWTMKKLLLKIRIKLKAKMALYAEIHQHMKGHLDAVIIMDGQLKECFKRNCVTDCPRTAPRESVSIPSYGGRRDRVVTGTPQPRDLVTTPRDMPAVDKAPQAPIDCESYCGSKGMTTQPTDPNAILAQLQSVRCVSGASVSMKKSTGKGCTCYSKASLNINKKVPVCNTACGPVECDSQTQCPCPNKPNCTLTAKCTWKGWTMPKAYTYVPKMG